MKLCSERFSRFVHCQIEVRSDTPKLRLRWTKQDYKAASEQPGQRRSYPRNSQYNRRLVARHRGICITLRYRVAQATHRFDRELFVQ